MFAFAKQSLEKTFIIDTPYSADLEEVVTVRPGKGKTPVSVLTDKYCEKMAYPHLVPLSANKYFNQWLLNYPQAFSEDIEYIFFAH